jgi:D-alanyl-D-alanine carboxypeptidase-like protein
MRILALPLAALAFHGSIQPLPAPVRTELAGHRWHQGCPVPLSQLRLLTIRHWGFDGRVHTGRLVVNAAVARPLLTVFDRLYDLRFPIRRMGPADDSPDNTAAFSCRRAAPSPCPGATGSGRWSEHAYGKAVDLNPVENPYTGCGRTRERASILYLDRSRLRKGMVTPAVVAAFRSIGWGWGGDWTSVKDYMHFSASGH